MYLYLESEFANKISGNTILVVLVYTVLHGLRGSDNTKIVFTFLYFGLFNLDAIVEILGDPNREDNINPGHHHELLHHHKHPQYHHYHHYCHYYP